MKNSKIVQLKKGLQRGDKIITEVTVRKALVPQLERLNLLEVFQFNTTALRQLLPKITNPKLVKSDFEVMEVADFMALATEAVSMLSDEMSEDDSETDSEEK